MRLLAQGIAGNTPGQPGRLVGCPSCAADAFRTAFFDWKNSGLQNDPEAAPITGERRYQFLPFRICVIAWPSTVAGGVTPSMFMMVGATSMLCICLTTIFRLMLGPAA